MSELGIPAKLKRLYRMTLSYACSSVKVGKDFSKPCVIPCEVSDSGTCDIFNFLMKSVLLKSVCIVMALFSTTGVCKNKSSGK